MNGRPAILLAAAGLWGAVCFDVSVALENTGVKE
jgi:hypothetical protein